MYKRGTANKGSQRSEKPTNPIKNHLYPIQVRKSSKDKSLSPLYMIDQDQKLQMNELVNCSRKRPCYQRSLYFFHATLFKRGKEELPSTLSYVSFPLRFLAKPREPTELKEGRPTQYQQLAKISSQSILACGQCTRRWSKFPPPSHKDRICLFFNLKEGK